MNNSFLMKKFFMLDQFSSVNRYAKNRSIRVENDLEHTGWVSLCAYLLAKDLQLNCGTSINLEKLLAGAICHDLDELLMGDVPRPLKYFNYEIRQAVNGIENTSINRLQSYLYGKNIDDSFLVRRWKEAKIGEEPHTLEQYIVTISDFSSVIYKVWQELIVLNNYSFAPVALESNEGVLKLIELNFYLSKTTVFCIYDNQALFTYFENYLNSLLELSNKCIAHTSSIQDLIPPLVDLK